MTKTETPPTANVESAPAVLTGVTPGGSSVPGNGSSPEPFVSIPQVGAYRTADHRYYLNGKGPLPSVTTILSVLDKPAIVQWAKRTVAEFAVSSVATGAMASHLLGEGSEATVKWLASLPDYQKDEAGKLGSGVHLLADMASRASGSDSETFQVSEQEKPYLEAFQGFLTFLRHEGAEIVSSEKMVWSQQGYAGTYDLIVRMPVEPPASDNFTGAPVTELWLLDIKTSKGGTYPEYALQLIAYGYADSIILEGSPTLYPMPKIQRYGVLHLRPDVYPDTGWRLIEYPVIEGDYVAFLGALEIWRWKEEKRYTKSILNKKAIKA